MYIVISIIGQTVYTIAASVLSVESILDDIPDMSAMDRSSRLRRNLLCAAVPGVIFYLVTRYMLKNRLNLE